MAVALCYCKPSLPNEERTIYQCIHCGNDSADGCRQLPVKTMKQARVLLKSKQASTKKHWSVRVMSKSERADLKANVEGKKLCTLAPACDRCLHKNQFKRCEGCRKKILAQSARECSGCGWARERKVVRKSHGLHRMRTKAGAGGMRVGMQPDTIGHLLKTVNTIGAARQSRFLVIETHSTRGFTVRTSDNWHESLMRTWGTEQNVLLEDDDSRIYSRTRDLLHAVAEFGGGTLICRVLVCSQICIST